MQNTIDLTPIFQAVIALLAALITYKLIPWIRTKTTQQQQDNLRAAARIAVYAAEQIFGSGKGDVKLDYALGALQRAGYDVHMPLVREAIEEAVSGVFYIMDNNDKPQEGYTAEPAESVQVHPPEEDGEDSGYPSP